MNPLSLSVIPIFLCAALFAGFAPAGNSSLNSVTPPSSMYVVNQSSTGSVWWVGAESTDSSALPNNGVESTMQVISFQVADCLSFWVADGLSNNNWGQVGYYICGGSSPVAFYQIWNLGSNTVLSTGSTSVSTGTHAFSMYLQSGTTWAYALDGSVFGTYDMGSSVSSSSYPVEALSEEQGTSIFSIPAVTFGAAMEVMKSGSWSQVQLATSYGTGWGVQGGDQNSLLQVDQIVIGGAIATLPQGTQLWGPTGTSTTTTSTTSMPPVTTVTTTTATVTSSATTTVTSTQTTTNTVTSTSTTTSTITSDSTSTVTTTATTTATGTATSTVSSTLTSTTTVTSVSTKTTTATMTTTTTQSGTATVTSTVTSTSPTTQTVTQTTTKTSDATTTVGLQTTTQTQTFTSTVTDSETTTRTIPGPGTTSTQTQTVTATSTTTAPQPTTETVTVFTSSTDTTSCSSRGSGNNCANGPAAPAAPVLGNDPVLAVSTVGILAVVAAVVFRGLRARG